MANAAHCTIVEVKEILEVGEAKPEEIHLPAFDLNRLFKSAEYERRIEIAQLSDDEDESTSGGKSGRDDIAKHAALAFEEGIDRNLSVVIPTLTASFASKFGSDVASGQIRSERLDMTVLGALETSASGDIANSVIPRKMLKGMGGAMDLVLNLTATKVLVIQSQMNTHWGPEKKECDLQLTGKRVFIRLLRGWRVLM